MLSKACPAHKIIIRAKAFLHATPHIDRAHFHSPKHSKQTLRGSAGGRLLPIRCSTSKPTTAKSRAQLNRHLKRSRGPSLRPDSARAAAAHSPRSQPDFRYRSSNSRSSSHNCQSLFPSVHSSPALPS